MTMTTSTSTIADRVADTPRPLRLASHFISFVLSPLLAPTYAVGAVWAATILRLLPSGTMLTLLLVVAGFTCLFPLVAIGVMYKLGIVSDPGLNRRRERTLPFVVSAAGYVAALIFLIHIHAPSWMTMFMAGGLLALVVSSGITFRWKISIHMTAIGGFVAFVLRLVQSGLMLFGGAGWLAAAIVAAGLVGTARLILYRHTPWQVAAGFLNGFLCVYLMMLVSW